jgi:hypothetical protein
MGNLLILSLHEKNLAHTWRKVVVGDCKADMYKLAAFPRQSEETWSVGIIDLLLLVITG